MIRFIRYTLFGTLVAVVLLAIPFGTPSYLNDGTVAVSEQGFISEQALDTFLYYHTYHPAFAIRQFVSRPIAILQSYVGWSQGVSFFFVQAFYIISAVVSLLYLAKELAPRAFVIREELYTLLGFVGTFSILFAYGIPIYTYDDFAQYTFIFLALLFGVRRQWLGYIISATLALFVRESTIILFPSLLLYFIPQLLTGIRTPIRVIRKYVRTILIVMSPLAVYYLGLFVASFITPIVGSSLSYAETERFAHFLYNIQTERYAFESILMFVLVCAFPTYLLIRAWRGSPRQAQVQQAIIPFMLAIVCNTAITLIATRAQEARIFALPLIFVWPMMHVLFSSYISRLSLRTLAYRIWSRSEQYMTLLLLLTLTLGFGYVAIWTIYVPTNDFTFTAGIEWYAAVIFTLCCLDLYLTE